MSESPLTSEQISEVKECFSLFDKLGTGTITLDEMIIIFRSLGQTPTQEDVDSMTSKAQSISGRGAIAFDDIIPIYCEFYKEPISDKELLGAFKKLDENNAGYLTSDRMRLLMASCSERMTEEEIELFIKNAKPDPEGKIDYNDFVKLMTSI